MKEAIEIFQNYFNNESASWDSNEYTPRIQSTVEPDERLSYNELHIHINKELTK